MNFNIKKESVTIIIIILLGLNVYDVCYKSTACMGINEINYRLLECGDPIPGFDIPNKKKKDNYLME